jgi:hypothetical protein
MKTANLTSALFVDVKQTGRMTMVIFATNVIAYCILNAITAANGSEPPTDIP